MTKSGDNDTYMNDISDDEQNYEEYDFASDTDKPFISEENFLKMLELLKSKKNIILEGAPGVGKTFS